MISDTYIQSGHLTEEGLLQVPTEWVAKNYRVLKKTSIYDKDCVGSSEFGDEGDFETIHITDGFEEIVLVDPALRVISEDLEKVFDDADAGADSQDAVKVLFLVLDGCNIRKVLGDEPNLDYF